MACLRKSAAALALIVPVVLAGCDSYYFHSGRFLEPPRRYPAALRAYENFLRRFPEDRRAAQVCVSAGDIYARHFQRCLEARRHYEAAARLLPQTQPWASRAQAGIMSCPDYFPLQPGRRWRYGDSESRGRYMRLDRELKVSSGAAAEVLSVRFAGAKLVNSYKTRYEKRDWGVWEYDGAQAVAILRYPFKTGHGWKARRGKVELAYSIDRDDAQVRTVAGTFSNCLKVREFNKKFPQSWKYDYYAPFVGKVKTTVAGPDFENPNTELIEYTAR